MFVCVCVCVESGRLHGLVFVRGMYVSVCVCVCLHGMRRIAVHFVILSFFSSLSFSPSFSFLVIFFFFCLLLPIYSLSLLCVLSLFYFLSTPRFMRRVFLHGDFGRGLVIAAQTLLLVYGPKGCTSLPPSPPHAGKLFKHRKPMAWRR